MVEESSFWMNLWTHFWIDFWFKSLMFVLGAVLGSFANVIIVRWPKGESVASPPSHCVRCKKKLRWFHNLPLLSYLFLRGKCAFCKAPISLRYPLVEVLMALLLSVIAHIYGMSWFCLEYSLLLFGLVVISFIDLKHMLIPNVFTFSGMALGLLGSLINPERSFGGALLGLLLGGGSLYVIAWIYTKWRKEEGLGGGDVKLLAWLGAVLGWKAIPFVVLSGSLMGSFAGLVLMLVYKKGIKTAIPFGPYLCGGALLYLLGAGDILRWYKWYLSLFFLQ